MALARILVKNPSRTPFFKGAIVGAQITHLPTRQILGLVIANAQGLQSSVAIQELVYSDTIS